MIRIHVVYIRVDKKIQRSSAQQYFHYSQVFVFLYVHYATREIQK